jgi:DNA-3-methyladenine glycosylase
MPAMGTRGRRAGATGTLPRGLRRVGRDFLDRDTVAVARALLGCVLAHRTEEGLCAGRIVETEAYLSADDPASHSHRGRTARNASMFAAAGTAYVYRIYGLHRCFNVVTGPKGVGEAVLVRALEPLLGLDLMRRRRGTADARQLCSGPGKLVQALAIAGEHDGRSLLAGPLGVWADPACAPAAVEVTPRIGITQAASLPLRFALAQCRFVSRR